MAWPSASARAISFVRAGRPERTILAAPLARDVETIVFPLLSKNGNTLVIECPDDVGVMHADQTKVRQALFNLLSNAAKFTNHGTITLRVAPTHQPLRGANIDCIDVPPPCVTLDAYCFWSATR